MADKSGKSTPDKTSADNPSATGKPSVDSQTPNSTPNDGGGVTHTRKYGSDAQTGAKNRSNIEGESDSDFVERGLVERHGAAIRDNPRFKEMVEEETRQINENLENTKGM